MLSHPQAEGCPERGRCSPMQSMGRQRRAWKKGKINATEEGSMSLSKDPWDRGEWTEDLQYIRAHESESTRFKCTVHAPLEHSSETSRMSCAGGGGAGPPVLQSAKKGATGLKRGGRKGGGAPRDLGWGCLGHTLLTEARISSVMRYFWAMASHVSPN